MNAIDPIFSELTSPGARFAIVERDGFRQFENAPANLNDLLELSRAFGDRTFIVDETDDGRTRRLSYEEVFAWRDRLSATLNISPGARIAICMRNRAEWIVAFLAVMRVGGVAVLLNSRGAPSELVAMIEEVAPDVVLADSERAKLIYRGGFAGRLLDITRKPDGYDTPGPLSITPSIEATDPCSILFTSGTTGRVKGAVLSHRNVITGLMNVQLSGMQVLHGYAKSMGMAMDDLLAQMPQPATLLVYPLFHISGLGSGFLSPLLSGTKIVIMRRWDAADALGLIEEERITVFSGVPTMLWDILNHAKASNSDLSGLTNVASGGQALPVNLLQQMRETCPKAMMGTGYGMTECAGAIAQAVGEEFVRKPESAGRVLPLVDVSILDDAGDPLPTGSVGEIAVRGAQVMAGYWNAPAETSAVVSADGWLRTGDVGMLDDEGYIFIVDRKKDMVISGGENIYCAEVERVLGTMPQITECATFGIPDDRLGELLVAVVRGNDLTEAEVIEWVGERLARYKAPGRVMVIDEPLPRNHLGKIDKLALRAGWKNLLGVA